MDTGSKKTYAPGESYDYQLLIRHILESPRVYSPDREIIIGPGPPDLSGFCQDRQTANALAGPVSDSATLSCFDYDSHRYRSAFSRFR